MRIAMVTEHASTSIGGGSERPDLAAPRAQVAEVSVALAQLGHEVRVYTRQQTPDPPPVTTLANGVQLVQLATGRPDPTPGADPLPAQREFSRLLAQHWREDWTPQVAHGHYWVGGLAAVGAGRQCQVPVVQTFHTLGSVERRSQDGSGLAAAPKLAERIRYERLLGGVADRLVAHCQDEAAELIRLGARRSQISVIPSGVDTDYFGPEGPAQPRRPGYARVLAVGGLTPPDGLDDLLRAMTLVPDCELVIVGGPAPAELASDPAAYRVQQLAEAYQLGDRVQLVGRVVDDARPSWYRSADVVARVPWHEPAGRTPLEAMACGVPVVATRVGELADSVIDGVTGALVRPRDPRGLAVVLRRLLADPLRRLAYGTAGLDRARQRYPWSRTAEELSAVYAGITPASVATTNE